MGCNEKCPASGLQGLALDNNEYCQGLVDVSFKDEELELRNICGAIVMAKVTYGQLRPNQVSAASEAGVTIPIS